MVPARCTARCAGDVNCGTYGIQPEEVAGFLEEYGWRLVAQAGPDELVERYVKPTGRKLTASQIEWSAFAEKV